MTMRRVVRTERFGDADGLELMTEPVPAPGPGEVLVAVTASGVNFADTMVRRGEYRSDQTLPCTPGFEVAGTVVAGGSLPPGTRVAGFMEHGGGYADHVVLPERLAIPVTADVSDEDVAASFIQGTTAWYSLYRYGRVRPGDTVLVSGAAGGVGGWTVQLAVEAGARVVGLASTQERRDHAAAMGCEATYDPRDPDLSQALEATQPLGFDVVVDGVGGQLLTTMLRRLAKNGRYVVVGSASQEAAVFDTRRLMPRGQTVTGFVVRNVIDADPAEPRAALDEVLARVADGRVRLATTVLPLAEAAAAHRLLEGRRTVGKIVLDSRPATGGAG